MAGSLLTLHSASRTLKIGDRLVHVCLRAKLITSSDGKCRLTFEHLIDVGLARIELSLLAFVLLNGILASDRGRSKFGFGSSQRLDGISDIHLDRLLELLSLRLDLLALNKCLSVIRSRGLVPKERQVELDTNSIRRIPIRKDAGISVARQHLEIRLLLSEPSEARLIFG